MLAEVTNIKDNEVELKLEQEDISIMYILQYELLEKKNVEFAGVILKHPLIEEYIIRILTKKKDPIESIQEASASASQNIKDLASILKTALKK